MGWTGRRRCGFAAATLTALAAMPVMAASGGAAIQLAQEPGREIGVACRFLDPDEHPVPPEAEALCTAAADLVGRKAAGYGKSVVRLGLRAVMREGAEDALPAVDGPILLLVLEGRPDWTGRGRPRLLLRARPVRGGGAAPSVGLPPVSLELGGEGWSERADRALDRVIGFALREG